MRKHEVRKYLFGVALALALVPCPRAAWAQARPCTFEGPPLDQARCLLRPVAKFGEVGTQRPALPAPLES
ncbi:MAG: hypothetical protein LC754_18780, partial [Acidobacteria bacterium]|nr:hypothetical protein [Acidobacteriota bacterium]